jgi:hypothetical protein
VEVLAILAQTFTCKGGFRVRPLINLSLPPFIGPR